MALEQGNDDEEEDIGVLQRRALHHSPISVASPPAPPEPMSGTRNRHMLVEASPAHHYIRVVSCRGISEPTEDRDGTTSPVPMSGTKDRPSLVDHSPAVPKVNNLCWGGGNPLEGGSATLQRNLVSPPSTTSPMEEPPSWVLPNFGGVSAGCNRVGACFCFPSANAIT